MPPKAHPGAKEKAKAKAKGKARAKARASAPKARAKAKASAPKRIAAPKLEAGGRRRAVLKRPGAAGGPAERVPRREVVGTSVFTFAVTLARRRYGGMA